VRRTTASAAKGLKAIPRGSEHRLRAVEPHPDKMGAVALQQGQEAPVARTKVEYSTDVARDVIKQHLLALTPPRELVGAVQVAPNVLGGGPFLGWHATIIRHRTPRTRSGNGACNVGTQSTFPPRAGCATAPPLSQRRDAVARARGDEQGRDHLRA
jgi:hypothetical protein